MNLSVVQRHSNSALEQTASAARPWQRAHRKQSGRGGPRSARRPPLLTAGVRLILSFMLLVCGLLLGCGNGDKDNPTASSHNFRPAIYPRPDTLVAFGDTLRFRIHAYDPEGDRIRFGVQPVVLWGDIKAGYVVQAGIDELSGDFWFWPGLGDIPVRFFHFSADDQHGGHTEIEVRIDVQ
jgi:hypothetical protein